MNELLSIESLSLPETIDELVVLFRDIKKSTQSLEVRDEFYEKLITLAIEQKNYCFIIFIIIESHNDVDDPLLSYDVLNRSGIVRKWNDRHQNLGPSYIGLACELLTTASIDETDLGQIAYHLYLVNGYFSHKHYERSGYQVVSDFAFFLARLLNLFKEEILTKQNLFLVYNIALNQYGENTVKEEFESENFDLLLLRIQRRYGIASGPFAKLAEKKKK